MISIHERELKKEFYVAAYFSFLAYTVYFGWKYFTGQTYGLEQLLHQNLVSMSLSLGVANLLTHNPPLETLTLREEQMDAIRSLSNPVSPEPSGPRAQASPVKRDMWLWGRECE